MYLRQILTVLGAFFAIVLTAAFSFQVRAPFLTGGDNVPSAMHADVIEKVDQNLNGLHKKVHSRMPASAKVEMLKQALSEIAEVRKQSPLQTVDKEVYLDFSTESLEPVAKDQNFSVEKCPDYKARVMNDFEPYSENSPSNPALKRSYEIIEGICS